MHLLATFCVPPPHAQIKNKNAHKLPNERGFQSSMFDLLEKIIELLWFNPSKTNYIESGPRPKFKNPKFAWCCTLL
jgi:hypothetical protein